ncbi:uncharacterized protein LOC100121300 isoform X2 [Nasonia vitripennis]|uniref:EGF-like domain-containing protein n=1 Tax=Nasonia vitripennis TaxID=7425 RepID=A0A7M7H4Q4_NASVI|nr:uncharacterized protein LOC100121300 isoform X2 [Nasonia vitripennis]
MPIAAGGILVAATVSTRGCLSLAAGMLRFLARLSGRRRHVRRFSSSGGGGGGGGGPGAATTTTSTTTTTTTTTARGSEQLLAAGGAQQPSSVVMDTKPELTEEYCCSRCRARQACSCAALGLDDYLAAGVTACCSGPTSYSNVAKSRTRHQRLRPESSYAWIGATETARTRRRRSEDCGCADDRDVLRRRPPEQRQQQQQQQQPPLVQVRRQSKLLPPYYLATLLILSYSLFGMADACSSRSTPKPRPPTPTPRPNITFHMYTCPPDYAEWYCLNGATCFTVKIVESLLYNCLCANGYIGQRCEFKDLDGSYLPSRQRVMLETASIAGAVTIAVFLAVITFISVYIHCKRKQKELRTSGVDAVDGPGRDPELRPFSSRSRSLMIFMAKNPNSSTMAPSIEQTRMPNWNFPAESSTRMASVNETSNKRSSQ